MKELAALGYAVAHWSFLEEAILQATLGIADEFGLTEMPMSSPQMMTMFGFCCCAAAEAGTNELSNSAHIVAALKYLQRLLGSTEGGPSCSVAIQPALSSLSIAPANALAVMPPASGWLANSFGA